MPRTFGKPVIVAINQFAIDTPAELGLVHAYCESRNVPCATANVFGAGRTRRDRTGRESRRGRRGARDPAQDALSPGLACRAEDRGDRPRDVWRRRTSNIQQEAETKLRKARKLGYGQLPICMAKTQDSLSDNPKLRGRPTGFTVHVRDIEIAAGAGFLVALTGEIMRMPGLPERPAAERIDVDAEGTITGLS